MKKNVVLSVMWMLLGCSLFAQITPRTNRKIDSSKLSGSVKDKPRVLAPSGTAASTQTNASTTAPPAAFKYSLYNDNNFTYRTTEINPKYSSFAFHISDYSGDGVKDITYRDFMLEDLTGLWLQKTDNFTLLQKSVHTWNMYSNRDLCVGYKSIDADVNGDGRPDIITYHTERRIVSLISSIAPLTNGYPIYQLGGSGLYLNWPSQASSEYICFPGDFNNDGKGDIAAWFYQTGQWEVALSNGTFLTPAPGAYGAAWINDFGMGMVSAQPVTGDYNGDGYTDIAIRDNHKGDWQVAINNKNNSFTLQPGCNDGAWIRGWAMDFPIIFRSGDFNGDNMTDLLAFDPNQRSWQYVLSNGSCFTNPSVPFLNFGDANTFPAVADINGDRKADIIACNLLPSGTISRLLIQIALGAL